MKVLLIAATAMEIAPAVELLVKSDFMAGDCKVSVLITGIGQTATTWKLADVLHTRKPDFVIQAGIAGTFSKKHPLGSVVYVQQDAFGDLGMEENSQFTPIFPVSNTNPDTPLFTDGWLINKMPVLNDLHIEPVKAVTVNKISDSTLQRQQLIDTFNPGIETMEGAAFHYVCLKTCIPFIQLRAISNYVGERDKSKWQMQEAIDNLNHKLLQLIEALDK